MRCVSHIGRVVASLLFVLSPLAVERAEPTLKACIPMLVSCMTAAFLLTYYQSLVPSQVIGCIASFIVGFGYFFIVTCLYLGLAAAVSLKAALAVVGISQVIEQLLSVALSSFCPRTWQIILCIALPLVVMVAFPVIGKPGNTSRNRDSQDVLTPCGQGAHRGPLTPVVRYQLVLLIVASAAINATAMLSDVGTWGYIRSDYRSGNSLAPMIQTVFAGAIVLAATYACLIQTLDKPITHRYQRAFLFLVGIIMAAVTAHLWWYAPGGSIRVALRRGVLLTRTHVVHRGRRL